MMQRFIATGMLLAGWLLGGRALPGQQADFFVATNGNDAWSGKPAAPNAEGTDGPFATLARARDAVRAGRKGKPEAEVKPATVAIRGGVYRLAEPLVFGPADSHCTFAAYPGERPVISGGRVIGGFQEGEDGWWRTRVPAAADGKWHFNELFVNGRRRTRARHPNAGYLRVEKAGPDNRTSFTFKPGDVPPLRNVKDAELVFLHDWEISRVAVARIDARTNTLKTADPIGAPMAFMRITGFEPHPRYFIENAIELLDAPGEWFLDRATGVLTYNPMPGEQVRKAEVVAPFLTRLVTVARSPHPEQKALDGLCFRGLTFEHCLFVRPAHGYGGSQAGFHQARGPGRKGYSAMPAALDFTGASCSTLIECKILQVGGSGVHFHRGCSFCGVGDCEIADVGGNGVMLGDPGNLPEKGEPAKLFVRNSRIHHCGQLYYGCVGVWAGIVNGVAVQENEISRLPYTGVSVGWSWNTNETGCGGNRIERNHIHHVMQVLSDGGGIYTLGRQPGTVLRGNLIHDVPRNTGRAESNGLFIDEGSSRMLIEGNTIYATARSPIRFHKATGNTVRGNVLVCPKGVPPFRYNATDPKSMTYQANTTPDAATFKPPTPEQARAGPKKE